MTKVYYVAKHGKGGFSDPRFNTIEEAQAEIDRVTNGIKSHDHTQRVKEEYRAYWKDIGENMYIVKQTVTEERI